MTEHGTRRTYQSGCRCTPCKAANAQYMSHLRRQHAQGITPMGAVLPAVEAWRRIKQLKIEHLTRTELSRRLGLRPRPLRVHPEFVRLKTILRIRHVYRQLVLAGHDQDAAAI